MKCLNRCLAALIAVAGTLSNWAGVKINEIHFDPDVKTELVEFIELYNDGADLNLSGWTLSGAVDFTFPPGSSIAGNNYQVVCQNPGHFAAKFGRTALGPWVGALRNEGEEIVLRDNNGVVIDRVDYQLGFPWPTVGEPPGFSIELVNPAFDNDLGGNWRAAGASPSGGDIVVIPAGSSWKYFKGLAEPSSPMTAWRNLTFDDSGWSSGNMPIGYDPSVPMNTALADMNGNYTQVYFRKVFNIPDPSLFGTMQIRALYDDGFKVWINGKPLINPSMPAGDVTYDIVASGSARESSAYDTLNLPSPSGYLVQGQNVIAIQGANILLSGSSDFYLDVSLVGRSGGGVGPSPFARNNAYTNNLPPAIRQVDHSPNQPPAGTPVVITAKVTDPEGVSSVQLQYQIVNPGAYIELTDAAYATSWTTVSMNDTGADGDEFPGDSVFTATVPASVQTHRRLIRYRIAATDSTGKSVIVPYANDPQPNFAYFCYNGVPDWTGRITPGGTPTTYPGSMLAKYPTYHLISKKSSVEASNWLEQYGGDLYKWSGTLVFDGKVYDHIHYRARGGVWRYAMGKNMWKFDFNRGHDFQAKDNWGRDFPVGWTKLNLGACIQQGDFQHRGEQGMFESVGFRLFNLTGLETPQATFAQFRVIQDASESSASQYTNDFWGLYLSLEQEDSRFLQGHNMPDSNLYKMEGGTGELNNQGQFGPTDKSDLNIFLSALRSTQTEAWWRANFDLGRYYNYRAIVEGIHHYDIDGDPGKNYFYYHNDVSGQWEVHPWDLDLTWADNMYGGGNEQFRSRVLSNTNFNRGYKNRVREIRDLLFNNDQAYKLIDEYAAMIHTPGQPSMTGADRARWDYAPVMASSYVNPSKSGQGRFYLQATTKDFPGMVQIMKNYVLTRGSLLDSQAVDSGLPPRPTITNLSPAGNPANKLRFQSSAYSGGTAFAAMMWRIGEISPTNAPVYDPNNPRAYEIEPVWQSPEITVFNNTINIPAGAVRVGKTYRARVKMKDTLGRWSNWSQPAEFVAGAPDTAQSLVDHLRITEVMFNPPLGSDYEFVEVFNSNTNITLELAGAKFTSGIDYTFTTNSSLAPQSYILVTRASAANNFAAFRTYYGVDENVIVLGPYSGNLNNDGEELTLKTTAAGATIATFTYGDNSSWPVAADGAGHSIVPLFLDLSQANNDFSYPGNWRASAFIKGSPGRADPEPVPGPILNEIMAHTDFTDPSFPGYDSNDWIEILNPTGDAVNWTDWYLSDDSGNLKKWAVPGSLAAGARVVFDETTGFHFPLTSGFGLDKIGEEVFLSYLPAAGLAHIADAVKFKGQPNTNSLSRVDDGNGPWRSTLPTRNNANGSALTRLVITEVMYHPATNANETIDNTLDEFVEIHNPTANGVLLFDENVPWRIDGGINYQFPTNITLAPNEFFILVNFDPVVATGLAATFKNKFNVPAGARLLGPYSGKLSNNSDRIAIERPESPDLPGDPYSWIVVDEMTYGKRPLWPIAPDGTGTSLHRSSAAAYGNAPSSWFSAPPNPGQVLTVTDDRDNDGMTDQWEVDHGLNPDSAADADEDADEDGLSNALEFQLGSDPQNENSGMQIDSAKIETNTLTVRAYLAAGVGYILERCTDWNSRQWTTVREVDSVSTTGWLEITDPNGVGPDNSYYRLRLKP